MTVLAAECLDCGRLLDEHGGCWACDESGEALTRHTLAALNAQDRYHTLRHRALNALFEELAAEPGSPARAHLTRRAMRLAALARAVAARLAQEGRA